MLMSIIHLLEVNKNTERKEGGMGEGGRGKKEGGREGRQQEGREESRRNHQEMGAATTHTINWVIMRMSRADQAGFLLNYFNK